MKTGLKCGAAAIALAAFTLATASAAPLTAESSAVTANSADLAAAKRETPRASVEAFLAARGKSAQTAASLVETASFTDRNGVTHFRYEQRIGGLRVVGGYAKAAFKGGALIHMIERTADAGGFIARPTISDRDALGAAIGANFKGRPVPALTDRVGPIANFIKTPFFYRAPTVERVIVSDRALSEGFLVETWSADDNLLYHTVVDGVGNVVSNELRTQNDSYNVFTDHPDATPQSVVAGPGAGGGQSPSGWLSGAQTTINIGGNNVRAYLDRNANNAPDAGGLAVTDGNFLTVADLGQAPTVAQNQDVAVQNLFYLNNVIHDRLRQHGFNEAAGNFQNNNFGNGGAQNDAVNAEAQDGGGTNNANFATPSDGSRPRMQMYLWTSPNPDRDGDLDSDIVWHEYGHGLTWRMIGSMSGNVPGAIGEGMGDALGIIVNNDDRTGEYSTLDPDGIRSIRYSLHLDTIGDFSAGRGVHRNGEIIAATVWDMWKAYEGAGHTQDDALSDIVGGMNFIPAAPNYFHMRDGFLAQAPAARDCLIWTAFAARGMGFGGSMNSSGSSITESFSLPTVCGGPPPTGPRLVSVTGAGVNTSGSRWRASMTANVDNGSGAPQSGVVVNIAAVPGGTGSCTTATDGQCSVQVSNLRRNTTFSVTFTVTGLNGNSSAAGVPQSVVVNRP
ncbi:MAG: M36 family metallopeptidase [Parvularculaceae bacterium]